MRGFDLLLQRLGPDAESAGAAFERLRRALTKFFDWRNASWPEECADATLDRVASKLADGEVVKDVPAFARGVARFVLRESARANPRRPSLDDAASAAAPVDARDGDESALAAQLDRCLAALDREGRELVLAYYSAGAGRRKIEGRQQLARRHRLTENALRSRVQRLRERLEQCVRARHVSDRGPTPP